MIKKVGNHNSIIQNVSMKLRNQSVTIKSFSYMKQIYVSKTGISPFMP